MIGCATCGQPLPDDPNESEEVVNCRYCHMLFCSDDCAEEHEAQAHPDEALPSPDESEDRR